MHIRKFISMWTLLAVLFGHVALTQHNATHINHGISFVGMASAHHDDHNHEKDKEGHPCPECVLIKSLQDSFYNSAAILFFAIHLETRLLIQQSSVISFDHYKDFFPRAPPTILI